MFKLAGDTVGRAEMDDHVAGHSGVEVHLAVWAHVNLGDEVVPEGVCAQVFGHFQEVLAHEGGVDMSRGHHEVGVILPLNHFEAVLVNVVGIASFGHHAQDGQALRHVEVDDAVGRLIAFHAFDETVGFKGLDDFLSINRVHQQANGIELGRFEQSAHLINGDKARVQGVGEGHLHARTYGRVFLARGADEGIDEVACQNDDEQQFE